jgi:integrin alpha 9
VIIFNFPKNKNVNVEVLTKLEGTQMGEYFGSTIATIDINQDGLTDLIIGAPMYTENVMQDVGRVYVYMNKDQVSLRDFL